MGPVATIILDPSAEPQPGQTGQLHRVLTLAALNYKDTTQLERNSDSWRRPSQNESLCTFKTILSHEVPFRCDEVTLYLFYRRHQNIRCRCIYFIATEKTSRFISKDGFFCSLEVSEMSGKATWPPEKGSPVLLYHLIGTTVHHSNVASLCALGAILISWIVPPNMTSQTSHESGWIVSTSLSYRKTWKNLKANPKLSLCRGVRHQSTNGPRHRWRSRRVVLRLGDEGLLTAQSLGGF